MSAEPARQISEEAPALNLLAELQVLLEHHHIPAKGFLTIDQAAVYLGATVKTLREWIRTKRLPFYKPGKALLFKRAELEQWMDRFRHQEGGFHV